MKHKQKIIIQLLKTCSDYDAKFPEVEPNGDQSSYFHNVVIYKALRKLTNKQLEQLIKETKNKISS
jgi:hypothetical protein